MRTAIYKAIAARLENAGAGVQHVGLWNRDTDSLARQKAFRLPAVFVEFEPLQWTRLAAGARSADLRVRLHVVNDLLASDGDKYQDKALQRLDLVERVSAAVQGLSGDGFNTFMPVESVTDHDHDRVTRDEEAFVTRVTDTSAVPPRHAATGVNLALETS
ncbi:MAG: hypothetical protein LBP56_07570 [Odoribacteraceae bacterium]|jgi:hypothetical protein|nr:hypothetical protein [Odoribacteraceae bacterium]